MTTKDRILARRAKFIAAAVVTIAGCSDNVPQPEPQACLSPPHDSAVDTRDARDSEGTTDTEPTVCLSAPIDSSTEDTADGNVDDAADAEPMPCLKMPPPDGG